MRNLQNYLPAISMDTVRVFVRDTFVVGVFLWATLHVLELLKPGFASNYVSLPLLLLGLFVLAIAMLALDPAVVVQGETTVVEEPSRWLFVAYGLVFVGTALAIGLSFWLTLGLAFVTLLALWALSIEWKN